ncbi:MAG: thioredoxin [Nitrospirae bacterium]|nr:thioredoxin [Nitrospirota bacterium]
MKTTFFLAAMLCIFMATVPCDVIAGSGDVTDDTFHDDVIRCDMPVVVEFWAARCPACRMMSGVVDELASEYKGLVKVLRMNTDENHEMTGLYEVERIPTFVYFRDGYEESRAVGSMTKDELIDRLGLP